ncbi:related to beta-galactosidase [Fusarium mangiferae]|uniref:Related to beta-galactosidase n=1 Tax=Fusarium mangiferae TaxID=192010 RepID=A0A1L7TBN7_FUSMA|nr:uncharacterized protein FMAN_14009 [Fusarium mangiferae]CVK96130.1 related to beta-galactosidase [Fusarium mangiferae]
MSTVTQIPRLHKVGNTWELLVDGQPYLILGGELQNSSLSSYRYMDTVWDKISRTGVNTVLGGVGWEEIEPEEGSFDFTNLSTVIEGAREHDIRLILLWFGSWKNGKSTYAPSWVKRNPERFPRMYYKDKFGRPKNSGVLSVFSNECSQADAKAFSKMLDFIAENDKQRTVIMVQVENEPGFHHSARDHSAIATNLFSSSVPRDLVNFLTEDWNALHPHLKENLAKFKTSDFTKEGSLPSWEDTFGVSVWTDELFMAYHYALYVERVASAGRERYSLPLYTNVWLAGPSEQGIGPATGGAKPGEYPSGGGVSTVLDIWQKFAPTLDFIAPDLYHAQTDEECEIYKHKGQALFIPEQRRDDFGGRRLWVPIGSHKALGTSPFGIDTQTASELVLAESYQLLGSVASHVLEARRKSKKIVGIAFEHPPPAGMKDPTPAVKVRWTAYELTISRAFTLGIQGPGYGLVIEQSPTTFLLIGKGFKVEWKSNDKNLAYTDIIRFTEKSVSASGALTSERWLNGDETQHGAFANMPNNRPDQGEEWVPVTIPARTAIAEVEVFSIED